MRRANWLICLCMAILTPFMGSKAHAAWQPLTDLSYFTGIDTIYVLQKVPNVESAQAFGDGISEDLILDGLKKVFSSQPSISILTHPKYASIVDEMRKPNMLSFIFVFSARTDNSSVERKQVASLSLEIQRHYPNRRSLAVPNLLATYPFTFSSKEQKETMIKDGIHFLTSFLPNYFECANKSEGKYCREFDNAYTEQTGCDIGIGGKRKKLIPPQLQ